MTIIKSLLAATVAIGGLTAAASANAAVVINISQAGANVAVSASGTFNTAAATVFSAQPTSTSFSQNVVASIGFVALGTQSAVSLYNLTGPALFGTGSATITSNTGTGVGMNAGARAFWIASNYVSNSQFASSGIVTGATLASIGLTSGVYNYTVGGNAVTLNIGQSIAAVPEPATWGMMILGFGMIGAAARSRKTRTTIRFA